MKPLLIAFWKWRMKANYFAYLDARYSLSCGAALAMVVSPRVTRAVRRVNACGDRLRALGENAPRLLPKLDRELSL